MTIIPVYSRWLVIAIVLESWRGLFRCNAGRVQLAGPDRHASDCYIIAFGPLRITSSAPAALPAVWRARIALAWEWLKTLVSIFALVSMIDLIAERDELRQTVRVLMHYCPALST